MTILDRMTTHQNTLPPCPEEERNLENVKAYKAHVNEVKSIYQYDSEVPRNRNTN
jgi:hypothetical protein